MTKKNVRRKRSKTVAASAACVMAAALMLPAAMPVFAAVDSQATVDETRTGTLVIHKLVENDGVLKNADGIPQKTDAVPVDNIGFDHVRLAALKTLSGVIVDRNGNVDKRYGNGEVSIGAYYEAIPSGSDSGAGQNLMENLFREAGVTPEKLYIKPSAGAADSTMQMVYTTESLEAAMQNIITTLGEDRINLWVKEHAESQTVNAKATMGKQSSGYTDADGTVTFSGLPLGLYMVAETDYSCHDGKAGAWNDGVSGVINHADGNTYDASGYHIQPVDGWGQETVHHYKTGEYYQESHNPESPVIETPAAPFLVSLPSTNTVNTVGRTADPEAEGEAGTVWQYTIDVYPKNQTTAIYKRIVDPDEAPGEETLRTSEDYQIGDKIEQIIWADAPVLQKNYLFDADDTGFGEGVSADQKDRAEGSASKNRHIGYVISDTMTKGLTFEKVTEVLILPKQQIQTAQAQLPETAKAFQIREKDGGIRLSYPADYHVVNTNKEKVDLTDSEGKVQTVVEKIEDGNMHGFAVVLTEAGLEKLNACTEDSVVAVKFDSILNKDATIGQVAQNMNYPTLSWVNTNTSFRTIRGNEVYDYTYELQLRKKGVVNGKRVRFVVSRKDQGISDGDVNQAAQKDLSDNVSKQTAKGADDSIRFVKEADGIYHVWGFLSGDTTAEGDGGSSYETSAVNGTTYHTVTPAKDGRLVLKGLDSNDYIFKEIQTEKENNLLKDTFTVSLRAADDTKTQQPDRMRDGRLLTAKVTSAGGSPVDLQIGLAGVTQGQDVSASVSKNAGIAALEVNNFDAIDLRTGGAGTTLLYVIGSVFAAGLCAGIIVHRRKEQNT